MSIVEIIFIVVYVSRDRKLHSCLLYCLRARFHVLLPVHFLKNKWVDGWKRDGAMCPPPSPKDWYPTWMGMPHYMLCKDGHQKTGGPKGQEDMCRLESSSDQNGRSP